MWVALELEGHRVFGLFDSWEEAVRFSDKRNPRDPAIDPKMTFSGGSMELIDVADELSDLWEWLDVEAPTTHGMPQ